MKFACIARHRSEFSVRLMCGLLGVSPSGFYASLSRLPSRRACANQRLKLEIRALHAETKRRYGAPKIHHELEEKGICCGHNRVARLMREDGLRSKRSLAFRVTTNSDHQKMVARNYLSRRFDIAAQSELDRTWVGDITYLSTREGWVYLAVILDLASRRVVGWCADKRIDQGLTLRALQMALEQRKPEGGLMHHTDRGVQYASDAYQSALAEHGITCSMSRRGDCWDNAVAESFFATLKTELAHDAHWETRESARRDLFEYIEVWYNRKRRHASLGYLSPAQYEATLHSKAHAA